MADINTAIPLRFASGSLLKIRATGDTDDGDSVLNIVSGSLSITVPGEQTIELADQGQIGAAGSLLAGDERPIEVSFDIRFTAEALDPSQIVAQMTTASSDGTRPTFELIVEYYDAGRHDQTTGFQLLFERCFLPEGYTVQTATGQEVDSMSFTVRSFKNSFTKTDIP